LQKKTRVKVWLYEDTKLYIEGVIIGFDEYMNMVLDDAVEIVVHPKKENTNNNQPPSQRTAIGRILLKGDAVALLQYVVHFVIYIYVVMVVVVLTIEPLLWLHYSTTREAQPKRAPIGE
jgi:small nuclear ribonucleoprotein E